MVDRESLSGAGGRLVSRKDPPATPTTSSVRRRGGAARVAEPGAASRPLDALRAPRRLEVKWAPNGVIFDQPWQSCDGTGPALV
jgi:hypothetical protein